MGRERLIACIDVETRSADDLSKVGKYNYDCEVLYLYIMYSNGSNASFNYPIDHAMVTSALDGVTDIIGYNVYFDLLVLQKAGVVLPTTVTVTDIMQIGLYYGLPAGLSYVGEALGLGTKSDGLAMRMFCKPMKDGTFLDPLIEIDLYKQLKSYCDRDVALTYEIAEKIGVIEAIEDGYEILPAHEACFLEKTNAMNALGFPIDTHMAEEIICLIDDKREQLSKVTPIKATSTPALREYFKHRGWTSFTAANCNIYSNTPDLTEEEAQVLSVRCLLSSTSLNKYSTALSFTHGGRIKDSFRYCGASLTGRDAGQGFQPQNMPRANKGASLEEIKDLANGDDVSAFFMACKDSIRHIIRAKYGNKLVWGDYSNIESRVLAWLAGYKDKLNFFVNPPDGADVYKMQYATAFGVDIHTVTKEQRQIGKVLELAYGYGGGAASASGFMTTLGIDTQAVLKAVEKYSNTVHYEKALQAYNAKEDRLLFACDVLKNLWRNANKEIVKLWGLYEAAATTVLTEGIGAERDVACVSFRYKEVSGLPCLDVLLPSLRSVRYYEPRVDAQGLVYKSFDVTTKHLKHDAVGLYGGKIVANVTQAVARDILASAVVNIDAPIVMRVHDEIVVEVPEKGGYNEDSLKADMLKKPYWAKGLPIEASCEAGYYYGK